MKRLHWLLTAAIALALSATAWADQILYFKDSSRPTIKGQIAKTAEGYEVRHGGGSAAIVFPESEVDRVEELKTPQDEYRDKLAKINPTDPLALYKLADWAIENSLKIEAKELLEKALKIDPNYENARLKLRQLELSMRAPTSAPAEMGRPAESVAGSNLPGGIKPEMLVSQEDVYRIRLAEIRPDDNVNVEFRNKALEQFIKSMEGQGDFSTQGFDVKFRNQSRAFQAAYMLEKLDRTSPLLQDILIKTDPKFILTFRTKVWPILQAGCASTRCHGGINGAGGMRLYTGSANEKVVYTNFLTLHAYGLLDRGNPESSPLLEYGLPSNLAKQKHRVVPSFNPIYQSRDAASYRTILDWIKSLKYPMLGEYPVEYKVPGASERGAASAPAEGAPAGNAPSATTTPAVMPWQAPGGTTPGTTTPPRNPAVAPGIPPSPGVMPSPPMGVPPSPAVMPGPKN